jgi:hypothetical protein
VRGRCTCRKEEVEHPAFVDAEIMLRQYAQRADLRGECDAIMLLGNIQRLDPERVARERQSPLSPVPDRDGVHAFEAKPGIVLPAQVARQQGLGVAVRPEAYASPFQFPPQVEVIVDLAVEHDRIAVIGREHRLVPARDVDDAQPTHAEAEVAFDQQTAVVRPAMNDSIALCGNHFRRDRPA